jgi:hypothetical protein
MNQNLVAVGFNPQITVFQQFIAKTCISLFFEACCHFAPPTTSKLTPFLCEAGEGLGMGDTNRIQREFDSNGAIPPFGGVLSLRAAEKRRAVTSRP